MLGSGFRRRQLLSKSAWQKVFVCRKVVLALAYIFFVRAFCTLGLNEKLEQRRIMSCENMPNIFLPFLKGSKSKDFYNLAFLSFFSWFFSPTERIIFWLRWWSLNTFSCWNFSRSWSTNHQNQHYQEFFSWLKTNLTKQTYSSRRTAFLNKWSEDVVWVEDPTSFWGPWTD